MLIELQFYLKKFLHAADHHSPSRSLIMEENINPNQGDINYHHPFYQRYSHNNIYNHQNYHQSFPNANFHPLNPEHANAWRYPRSGPVINIDPETLGRSREFWGNCMLGFLVDYRIFKACKINAIIRDKWSTRGRVKAYNHGDIYVLRCQNDADREDILSKTYATFFGAIMVFTRWLPGSIPRTVRFPYAALWVRVCGLPFEYLSMHVANIAGNLLSHDFIVDEFDEIPNNDFLRIKVCIKLNEPLVPGFFLAMDEGHLLWVQFRYEDIFKYCIRCGKIGHKAACCRESIMTIVSSVNGMLDRSSERGFAVFQAHSNHTMFNMDLRATPSTTRFVNSRLNLDGRLNISSATEEEEERVIDFDLGTTPGGRVYPGMRFAVTAQPFAGPVIFQVSNINSNHNNLNSFNPNSDQGLNQSNNIDNQNGTYESFYPEGGGNSHANACENSNLGNMNIINNEGQHSVHPNIGGFIFNDDDNATLDNAAMDDEDGINNTPIDASLDHEMHESSEEDFITASEDSMEDIMQTEMGFDIANEDPYVDYGLFRRNVIPFDRNLNIQEGILNRIESDIEWARMEDDSMGYNQTFDPPPNGFPSNFHYPPSNNYHMGISNSRDDQSNDEDDQNLIITIDDTSSSSSPSPEVPSDHLANSDSLPAWSGEIMHQITDGSPSEVNTVLELNFGNSRHLPYSDTSHLSAATDFHPPISLASESIKLKGIELQAASTSISMMIANGSKEDILSGPESGLLNKVTDKSEVEILRGCSEGMMGLADWQSVTGERAEYGDLARAIRKRKSSSVPGYSPILEESLISIGYAKSYLTHLAKRNCCMKDQDIRDFYTKNAANNAANTADSHAAFKMKVDDISLPNTGGFRLSIDEFEVASSNDSPTSDTMGIAEVVPFQPPHTP